MQIDEKITSYMTDNLLLVLGRLSLLKDLLSYKQEDE